MEPFFEGVFRDRRLEKRANQILERIIQTRSAVANRYCQNSTEEMGNRRFMANPRIDNAQIKQAVYLACRAQAEGKAVLAIPGTLEINYQNHIGRLNKEDPDLGLLSNHRDIGFFLHAVLVVDAASGSPLGISWIHEWNREWPDGPPSKPKLQAIETQEAQRCFTGMEETKRQLPGAPHIIFIGERESLHPEEFAAIPDSRCDVFVRWTRDQRLHNRKETLFEHLAALPPEGEMVLPLKESTTQAERPAALEIRYTRVPVMCSAKGMREAAPPWVDLSVLEFREKAENAPGGGEPVHWRLAATRPIQSLEDARQCAEWYSRRGLIQELFRLLKAGGLDIEAAQYERGYALKRLAIFALQAAVRIMQ